MLIARPRGPPNRDPNQISLTDPSVFVQILDVEEFIPRPASADDVRIGDDWETGTPAEDFEILDINQDGNRDIQLRWSTQQLIDDGHLDENTTEITVWGMDQTTGDLYRGDAEVEIIEPEIVVCFDSGGFVTHPGAGAGGADVSMASPAPHNAAGSNVRLNPLTGGPDFRIADDFVVNADGCTVSQIVTHGYETGAATPTWTSANLNIWDHEPPFSADPIASATTTNWDWTGIYRTFNGVLINTDRPLHEIFFDFDDVELDPGTYWIDWQVVGGASGWSNYRMEPNPANPGAPITVFENGRQLAATGWQPILDPPGAETPFRVLQGEPPVSAGHGVPQTGRGFQPPARYGQQATDRAQ